MTFPPYGVMPYVHSKEFAAPADWRGGETYEAWSQRNLAMIQRTLWPLWDPGAPEQWRGESQERMETLTLADLELLEEFRPTGQSGAMGLRPEESARVAEAYAEYDPAGGRVIGRQQKPMRKLGNTAAYFKQMLQRPRAYQMAFLFEKGTFSWALAKSSVTAAIPSEHCLQGCIGAACLVDEILTDGRKLDPGSWEALQRLAVDVGDQRVLARIHYPSDNIASWLLALDLAEPVFDNPDGVRQFLWTAISERSVVYRQIALAMKNSSEARAAYGSSWDLLQKRGRG